MWAGLWGKQRDSLTGICPDYENLRDGYYKNLILKDLTPYFPSVCESEVNANLNRAQALRQSTLSKAFGIHSAQPEH